MNVPDTQVPDTSTGDAADAADATMVDAADSGVVPGEPFDPTKPKAGDPCPAGVNVNDTIDRRCGLCGNQRGRPRRGRLRPVYGREDHPRRLPAGSTERAVVWPVRHPDPYV